MENRRLDLAACVRFGDDRNSRKEWRLYRDRRIADLRGSNCSIDRIHHFDRKGIAQHVWFERQSSMSDVFVFNPFFSQIWLPQTKSYCRANISRQFWAERSTDHLAQTLTQSPSQRQEFCRIKYPAESLYQAYIRPKDLVKRIWTYCDKFLPTRTKEKTKICAWSCKGRKALGRHKHSQ